MPHRVYKKNAGNLYPNRYGYLYITPASVVLFLLGIAPFLYNLGLSLTDTFLASTNPPQFIGVQNYVQIFASKEFWTACKNSLIYVVFTVGIEFFLGFALAIIFQIRFAGKRLLRSLVLIPMIATPIAIAFIWRIILHPNMGIMNFLLAQVGIPKVLWLGEKTLAMISVIMVDVWQWTPFVFLIMSSGISALPAQPFESCLIDGGSFWQALRYVMLPLLRPIIFITLIFRLVDSIKSFDIIYILTAGGPGTATETLNIQTFLQAFKFLKMGYASALSIVILAIIMVITRIMFNKADLNFE